jgi:hypothetical protein
MAKKESLRKVGITHSGSVTLSLDDLKQAMASRLAPPKAWGACWTTDQIAAAISTPRVTLEGKLRALCQRRFKSRTKGAPWLYPAADIVKLAKEGKI